MRAPSPFAIGQIVGALVVGVVAGALVGAVVAFSGLMVLGAAASVMVCRWSPGYDAAGWRLWLTGAVANPLLIVMVAFSVDEYDCLLGSRTGWACMFSDVGPMVVGLCLLSPLFGVALRWLWRGPQDREPPMPPPRGPRPTPRSPGSGGPGSSPRLR
jgi:hypothetical protein